LAEGETIYTAGEDVQDHQLRILRNTMNGMSNHGHVRIRKSAVTLFLGGLAGLIGLYGSVETILHPVREQVGSSGLDTGVEILNLSVLFALPAAIIAILGATLSLRRLRIGGLTLVIAGLIGALGAIVPVALAYTNGTPHPDFVLFLTEIGIWWWDLMILVAGLIAIRRVHPIRKEDQSP